MCTLQVSAAEVMPKEIVIEKEHMQQIILAKHWVS